MTNNNNQNNQNQNTNPFGANNNNANNNNQNNSPFSSSRFANNNNNNQNNNSRFSGSSRFGNNNNNANNNQNNSRFGSGSRFGSNNQNNNQNNNRFAANRLNRFGQQTIYWTVASMSDAAIRISMDGLGDPFHRLLDMPLNVEYGNPEKVVEALQSDEELLEKLSAVLNEAWESYEFQGAALLFPWDEDVRKAYSQPVFPDDSLLNNNNDNQNNNNQNNNNDNDDYDDDLFNSSDGNPNVTCLRAIDLAFVLNILARARANVVVGNTPLALEPGFLTQTVVCDDPRIVAIARATGCIDEKW